MAMHVECQREDQRDDRHADDDVGQRQRLDDRVDRARPDGHAVEDGRGATVLVADREQQHVRRRLRHREAHREMDQVAARDDPLETDEEEPGREDVRQVAHGSGRTPGATYRSRNSEKRSSIAAVTSSAVAQLSNGRLPPDSSVPRRPGPMKLCRKLAPASRAPAPSSVYAAAPMPSAKSSQGVGVRLWYGRKPTARNTTNSEPASRTPPWKPPPGVTRPNATSQSPCRKSAGSTSSAPM